MTTGVNCLVFIEGERAADGSPGESPTQPAILEDLKVSWGRSDTMTQPAPDTCTFSVLDPEGGEAFIGLYRTGTRIDVMAQGVIYPVPAQPTFIDGGFETTAITWAVTGGTAARSAARVHSGAQALAVKPTGAPVSLWLGPGAFQPAATNPDAWDAIPTAQAGQLWTLRAALWVPAGATATVWPALYSGPYATAGITTGTPTVVVGQSSWVDVSPELLVDSDGHWLGLNVVLNPIGSQWDQMPPALTWDGVDPALSWDDMGTLYVDDVDAIAPEGSSSRGVLVFSGRVTDMSASWDASANAVIAEVTCVGFTADLDNRLVGDEPWPVESVDARANRVLTLAALPISIDIDSPIDDTLVSWRDVDSQGATGLLQELAVSVDGVLWSAVHQSIGAYLRLEDPAMREALLRLDMQVGPAPVVQRTNLAINPSFEVDLTGWTASTLVSTVRDTTWSVAGASSVRTTSLASSFPDRGDIRLTPGSASVFPAGIQAGHTYTMSAWQNTPKAHVAFSTASTSRQRRILVFYSIDGATYVENKGPQGANIAGQQRLSHTFTIPANATGCILGVGCAGGQSDPSFITYVDGVLIEEVSALGAYFDGSTPDTPTADYAWTGAAHASASTQSTVQAPGAIVIVPSDPTTGFDLTACVILRDPVTWVQDVSDVITRVAVSWKVQGVDEEGNPTTSDATEKDIDATLEARYGTRNASVSTQLQAAADAREVASKVLARATPSGWRANGLAIDDDDVTGDAEGVAIMLDLLDGTSRIGAPITIGDLPQWSPAGSSTGVYLEGGTYRYVGGRWVLELIVSSAGSGLGESAQWDQLNPAWQWDQWSPELTWNDLRGVAGP